MTTPEGGAALRVVDSPNLRPLEMGPSHCLQSRRTAGIVKVARSVWPDEDLGIFRTLQAFSADSHSVSTGFTSGTPTSPAVSVVFSHFGALVRHPAVYITFTRLGV